MTAATKQKIMWLLALAALGFAFMRLPGCRNPGEGEFKVEPESQVRQRPPIPAVPGQKSLARPSTIKDHIRGRGDGK